MPSTVLDLFRAGALEPDGCVGWGQRPPATDPGVYVVVLTDDPESVEGALSACPLSTQAVEGLLEVRSELRMDGVRPSADSLAERIASFWLPDEVVLYVGLAGTSLANRLDQYYRTPLGARRPHAGGYFLKFLSVLPDLYVHYASTPDPGGVEDRMLAAFCTNVSEEAKERLRDSAHPFPFANLEWPAGIRKNHGLTGAREPGTRGRLGGAPQLTGTGRIATPPDTSDSKAMSNLRTQQVTVPDLQAGRLRIPRGATKSWFQSPRVSSGPAGSCSAPTSTSGSSDKSSPTCSSFRRRRGASSRPLGRTLTAFCGTVGDHDLPRGRPNGRPVT
jgi:hypothetical protein